MNFGFSDDQQAIKRTARDFLAARYPLATVRKLAEDDRGFTDAQWQELVELGWPGVIIPYIAFALPLAIYTLSAFFREIPWDLEKAAKIDGATAGQAFRKVIAPLAAPGIVTAAILVFIFAWNDLLLALSLTATKAAITAPVAIANFTGSSQFEEPTGSIAAGAMVITVPIIVFVLVFQRRIVAGLTSGAVKG